MNNILPYFVFPITVILIFLIFGLIKNNRSLIFIALMLIILTSSPIASNALWSLLENGQSRKSPNEVQRADAIVVLSGMISTINSSGGEIYEWTDPDRFFGGMELFKYGKSDRIIFTGGKVSDSEASKTEGEILSKYAQDFGIQVSKIIITPRVLNTKQEAEAVKHIMLKHDLKRIILVTSAFHMYRAKKIFESYGIQLETYPVDSKISKSSFDIMDLLPDAISLSAFQIGVKEFIGRVYYSFIINQYFNE